MTTAVTNTIRQALRTFNIGVTKYETLVRLREEASRSRDIELLLKLPSEHVAPALGQLKHSHSQLRQDIFVLSEVNFKRNGFFVEFGATDGLHLSNTYLLEHGFGWRGIVAEPAQIWHAALDKNRQCHIERRCVWSATESDLEFNQVKSAEYSTVSAFNTCDCHHYTRRKGTGYRVTTISLLELLSKYDAPAVIDYLSIDTEGSEFEILNSFDFNRYQFRVITCEHNFTPMRIKIHALLTSHGYTRKWEEISEFDDWYVMP